MRKRKLMKLSREEVLHIALLARLGLTQTEVDRFREQLSNILENFEILQQVDTSGILPTAQPNDLQNVLRDDKIIGSLSPKQVLANAPRKEGSFIRVRPVLE
jgi:aspartyl-tRNA(Asn)/glutamyl-tRNA(Gln) amidotransferase subunit C